MATVFGRLSQCIDPRKTKISSISPKTKGLGDGLSSTNSLRGCGSGFSSLKMACQPRPNNARLVGTSQTLIKPVASRVCPLTGKRSNNANKVSFSNHKTKKLQKVNLQYKRIWWEAGKRYVKLRISTKAMKTIEKNGLDAMAKKAGIDLKKL
uniref:Large ribosomal subunit protein bL28c n=1 Tax=Wollemia nobilis TaxID=56998 RepID=A0A0C9QL07_9CONI